MIPSVNPWWAGFVGFVLAMLALDLGIFHRKAHAVKMREALTWTGVWVTLAALFGLGISLGWIGPYIGAAARQQAALEFLTGYLIEFSLSMDNIFVFALLFGYFQVPPLYRHRVLFWGILGALVMRAVMIFAGVALLHTLHWVVYVFGAVLILGGFKMWRGHAVKIEPRKNPVLRLVRRIFPVAHGDHGHHFFIRENGALAVTPLFVVLVFVEWTDVVFAVDSIPAVLAVTHDPFIVFTSNVVAILGLRSLYFALASVMERFHLLHYGLAAILVFVGAKMLLAPFLKVPTIATLAVVACILAVSVIASLLRPPPPPRPEGERKPKTSRGASHPMTTAVDKTWVPKREEPTALIEMMPSSRLSIDLTALREGSAGKSVTIEELEKALKGRGFAMLLLLLALPFCLVSVPRLSTPFGFAVFVIGIRIAAGQKPWLPEFLMRKRLAPELLAKVLAGGIRFARALEKVVKPRMRFLQRWPGMMNLIGLSVALSGFVLFLPLPIPFSNVISAWAIMCLAVGMMERDGLLVLLGHLMTLVSWVFIAACWLLGAKAVEKFFDAFTGGS